VNKTGDEPASPKTIRPAVRSSPSLLGDFAMELDWIPAILFYRVLESDSSRTSSRIHSTTVSAESTTPFNVESNR